VRFFVFVTRRAVPLHLQSFLFIKRTPALKKLIYWFQSIKVSTTVDNLFVHPKTGDIWFGALPVRYKLLDYVKSPAETALPSQVKNNHVINYMCALDIVLREKYHDHI